MRDRKVGESVLVYPWIGCGVCRVCRDGYENLCMKPRCLGVHCDGGYADEIVVPHARYLLPLDGLDPVAVAPYACSGVTTYSALKKFGAVISRGIGADRRRRRARPDGAGDPQGDGRARAPWSSISTRAAARRRLTAGAVAAIDGAAPDALAQVGAALGGPCWAALDLVGSPQTAALAFDALGKGGKLVMVGLFGGAAPWSLPLIPMKAASVIGSYTGSLGETRELLDLVRTGAIPEIPIQTRPTRRGDADARGSQSRPHGRARRTDAVIEIGVA